MTPRRATALAAAGLAAALLAAGGAAAHEIGPVDVLLVVESNGVWLADLQLDLGALALGGDPRAEAGARDRLRELLERRVRVRFDGEPAGFAVQLPRDGDALVRLTGRVPDEAGEVSFFASRAFGPVRLTVVDQAAARIEQHLLARGERSPAFAVTPPHRHPPPDHQHLEEAP